MTKAEEKLKKILDSKIEVVEKADELARQAKKFRQQSIGLARAYNEYIRARGE